MNLFPPIASLSFEIYTALVVFLGVTAILDVKTSVATFVACGVGLAAGVVIFFILNRTRPTGE